MYHVVKEFLKYEKNLIRLPRQQGLVGGYLKEQWGKLGHSGAFEKTSY